MTPTQVVDVHRHAQPAECIDVMRANAPGLRPEQLGALELPALLAELDDSGIAAVVLQGYGAHTLVHGGDRSALARLTNDFFAEQVARAGGRVGAVAALPLPDVDAALAELTRSLDDLLLDAIGLHTSYAGRYLGDALFDPVLAELDRRAAVVVIHPLAPAGVQLPHLDFPVAHLEFPFETTRAVANMLVHDTLDRFPAIRFVVPHLGGAAPYLPMRLATGLLAAPQSGVTDPADAAHRVARGLRTLHYDLAVSAADGPVSSVLRLAGPGALLFGSDCPPGPRSQLAATLAATDRLGGLDPRSRAGIERGNARELFPRLR